MGSRMIPLPTRLLAAALLGCAALVATASARSPAAAGGPLELATPDGTPTFADGTLHPWAPPPMPPLPAAELWGDYQQPPIGFRLHKAHGHACVRRESYPVLSFVGGVFDSFLGLLTYPARKAQARHCHAGWQSNSALRDCGCYPAPLQPAIIEEQPPFLPSPPPDDSDTGLSPQPLVEPAPLTPIEPAPVTPQAESPRLNPGRAPVIELAPELTFPMEPDPLPPRNAIPMPGVRVPRNVIPRP